MNKFFLLIFLLPVFYGYSQDKYLIYFSDKSITSSERLDKSSEMYIESMNSLSQKSIQRRMKNMNADSLITFEDVPIHHHYISQIEMLGIKIENKLKWFNAVSSYLSEEQLTAVSNLSFVSKIEQVKTLVFTKPEFKTEQQVFKKQSVKTFFDYGPSFEQLQLSDVPLVHSKGITGNNVLIGLLDTGFDWKNHESFENIHVVAEYDFIFKDNITANQEDDVPSQHDHGTRVLSIIAGFKEASLIGSSFGSDFILAKTEDIRSETHVEEDNYAAALEWMEGYGVDVTSSSLGYNIFDPSTFSYTYEDMDGKTTIVTRAAELAYRRGVLTITSAGNEGNSSWYYITAPADGINTIAIGAVDANNNVAGFSSRGPSYDGRIKPDLTARGVSVYSARPGDFSGYNSASGTSVAAPIASGIAALVLSAHPHLKNSQLRKILLETAGNSSSPDFSRGYGLISALNAVEFPNLKETGGTFELHKIFLQPEDINLLSVSVHYSTDGENFSEFAMVYDGNLTHTFKFPYFFEGDVVDLYFTFADNSNNTYREPSNENYRFYFGQLDISLNLELVKEYRDFIVSEPYPNPFLLHSHKFTRLAVKSAGDENLKITIINSVGERVDSYQIITTSGDNYFDWYGTSENNIPVASGAYIFLIELNGKRYARKIILLQD
jgi:serine protease AprX